MAYGRFERLITVPTGGWSFTLSEDSLDVGPVTLAAGTTFYWASDGTTDRLANGASTGALKTALEAVGAGTYSVFLSDGEGGTGRLSISVGVGASAWGFHTFQENGAANNALRDLLGFTADITTDVVSATGDNHVQALWLPDGPYDNKFGIGDYGWLESDTRSSESASGDVSVIGGGRSKRVMSIAYRGLSRAKTRKAAESTTNESLERFYENDLRGDRGYAAQPGGPVRWYQDADDDSEYATLKFPDLARHDPDAMKPGWVGRWNHTFSRAVVQE